MAIRDVTGYLDSTPERALLEEDVLNDRKTGVGTLVCTGTSLIFVFKGYLCFSKSKSSIFY